MTRQTILPSWARRHRTYDAQNLCTFAREHMHGNLARASFSPLKTYNRPPYSRTRRLCLRLLRKERAPKSHTQCTGTTVEHVLVRAGRIHPEKNMVVAVTSNDGDIDRPKQPPGKS